MSNEVIFLFKPLCECMYDTKSVESEGSDFSHLKDNSSSCVTLKTYLERHKVRVVDDRASNGTAGSSHIIAAKSNDWLDKNPLCLPFDIAAHDCHKRWGWYSQGTGVVANCLPGCGWHSGWCDSICYCKMSNSLLIHGWSHNCSAIHSHKRPRIVAFLLPRSFTLLGFALWIVSHLPVSNMECSTKLAL